MVSAPHGRGPDRDSKMKAEMIERTSGVRLADRGNIPLDSLEGLDGAADARVVVSSDPATVVLLGDRDR